VRPFRLVLVVALAGVFAAALVASPADAKSSPKATKCTPPKTFPEAGGKFTSLTVTGGKCTTATSVANGWAKCATANGKGGRCVKKVSGYACGEVATTVGTTRTSNVTCGKGSVRVKFAVTRRI
jgi:hypothetical protein